jgi:hypothetical protein
MSEQEMTALVEEYLRESRADPEGGGHAFVDGLAEDYLALLAERDALKAQKDSAYTERNALVVVLTKLWPSHLARHPDEDTTWDDDWRTIVCVHSPVGQLTWHIKDDEVALFAHLAIMEDQHWDGHTTVEKYVRLASLPDRREPVPA